MAVTNVHAQDTRKEKAVRAYYTSYENKDWNTLSKLLADDFTFSSPAGDNHISLATYKEKCWPTSKMTKKVNFIKMTEKGNDLFLLVEINTMDNKVARNFDVFSFDNQGKIKAHECFFGPGVGYPGNTK
jgi:hypothetical protein